MLVLRFVRRFSCCKNGISPPSFFFSFYDPYIRVMQMLSELWLPCHRQRWCAQSQLSNLSKPLKCALSQRHEQTHGNWLSPVVSRVMLNAGLRGTPVLGCSLLLGEEITGHLQLPLISRGVWLEPSERPVGGCRWMAGKYNETETNVFQLSSTKLCPFTVLNMHVQIDLVCLPPQPNHLFPSKTDSFMCCYHVIMCCCAASSYSISEGLISRHKGRRGLGAWVS